MKDLIKKLRLKRRVVTALAKMHFYGNPSANLKIVGVTGTSGKTTTSTLLFRLATSLGYKAGLIGTVENIIVDEIRPATLTTPDPIFLNKLLKEMVERGCEYVFMEVSSHAIDQNRIAGIDFIGGVFTNLTHDHLDYHKTFEEYFNAKKKFFKMLPASAFALSNSDDENGRQMMEDIKARPSFYGFSGGEQFHALIKELNFSGLELFINSELVRARLLGKFNAYNLLAVYATAELLGFPKEKVKTILADIEPPRGRFDHFMSPSGVLVIVDYAHKPDALEKIFSAVKEVVGEHGKLISVFGCGGDRDPSKRPIMGKIGAQMSDLAIFTSDNPRGEDPKEIIKQMKTDLTKEEQKKVKTITDRRKAIKESIKIAVKGDIILCAGKGHEDYQIVKGVKSHFDDMEEFRKAYSK
jgi:UDP-N-acetylmuramoyl-L-alanyl-D-glutamate--2,6-diaminopimelate ligase